VEGGRKEKESNRKRGKQEKGGRNETKKRN